MPRTSEFDYGHEIGGPDITIDMMPPHVDPIKAKPDLTRFGESVDQLKAEEEARLHREQLLGYARKNSFTDIAGWGTGFASAVVHGAGYGTFGLGVGASAGYLTAGAISGIGELVGVPASETLKGFTGQEIAQYTNQAVESVAYAASYIFPDQAVDTLTWALNNFQTQVITGVGSISFGGYFTGKGWSEGWPKGDRFGRNIGTKASFPIVTLVDKLPFDMPKMPNLHIKDLTSRVLRRNSISDG